MWEHHGSAWGSLVIISAETCGDLTIKHDDMMGIYYKTETHYYFVVLCHGNVMMVKYVMVSNGWWLNQPLE